MGRLHALRDRLHRSDNRGAILLTVAIGLPVLLIITAAVTDFGLARIEKNRIQNGVDSGALAAVVELPDAATARTTAAAWTFNNFHISTFAEIPCDPGYDSAETTCYSGGGREVAAMSPYSGYAGSGSFDPDDLVHVETCANVGTTFARLIGVDTLTVCTDATAVRETAESSGGECMLCTLGLSGTGIDSTGAGRLVTNGGNIHVNSSNATDSIKITNSAGRIMACNTYDPSTIPPTCDPGSFTSVGGYSAADPANLVPAPTSGSVIADPLASLPVPYLAGPSLGSFSAGSTTLTLDPGVYAQILSSKGSTIHLNPGIYVITDQIKLNHAPDPGETSLEGDNVFLYFACKNYPTPCASGESSRGFSLSGGATIDLSGLSAPACDDSSPAVCDWQGMVVMFDRENTASFLLTGSSATSMTGTVYAKSSQLSLTGPSGVTTLTSAVIVKSVKKTGDSSIVLNFDDSLNYPGLLGAPGNPGGLVE